MPRSRTMLPIARELNHFGDAMGRRRGVREPHVQRVRFDRPALAANTAVVKDHAIVRGAQHTLVAQRFGSVVGVAVVTRLAISDRRGVAHLDFDAVSLCAHDSPIGWRNVCVATFPNTGVPLQ